MLVTSRAEPLGLYPAGLVAERDKPVGRYLDEACGPADERQRVPSLRPRCLGQQPGVDPSRVARPARWLLPGQAVEDLHAVAVGGKLVAVDEISAGAGRVQQPDRDIAAGAFALAQDGPQRDNARAAANEHERAAVTLLPHEVAADRAAQFQLIAHAQLIGKVRGYLPVVEPLHRDGHLLGGGRRDRVRPLRAVTVLSRQLDIQVLPSPVTRPGRDIQFDGAHRRRLPPRGGDRRDLPGQSPWYRCSFHGSPYMW